jgi:hypothetical protein
VSWLRSPQLSRNPSITRNAESQNELTLGQGEDPDSALLAPGVCESAGGFREISESDDGLEGWEFSGQAE